MTKGHTSGERLQQDPSPCTDFELETRSCLIPTCISTYIVSEEGDGLPCECVPYYEDVVITLYGIGFCPHQALLLPCKLEQVRALAHDCCTTSGHLEDALLLCLPCHDIEFLSLGLAEQATSASAKDGGRSICIEQEVASPTSGNPNCAMSCTIVMIRRL